MGWVLQSSLLLAALSLASCTNAPTREGLLAKETKALQCYCASNALVAEVALLDCAQYAEQCRKAAVGDIPYDQVLARVYGRLYLIERHLGNQTQAEQCLEKYARFHGATPVGGWRSALLHLQHAQIERFIDQEFNTGFQTAWQSP